MWKRYSPPVFCPRCGEESPDDVRYCASCGSALPKLSDTEPKAKGFRARLSQRVRRLAGRTRRERIISGVTAGFVVIAVVAFLNLDTPEEELPPSPQRDALDAACVVAKAQVVDAANALATGDAEGYAIRVVLSMMDLRDSAAASGLTGAADLGAAALSAASAAGRVGRLSREQAPQADLEEAVRASSAALDELSGPTEDLGLTTCTDTTINQGE